MTTSGINETTDVAKAIVSLFESIIAVFADKKVNFDDLGHVFKPARDVQDAIEGFGTVGNELATMTNSQSLVINDELKQLELKNKEDEQDVQELIIGLKAFARIVCRKTNKGEAETVENKMPANVNVA